MSRNQIITRPPSEHRRRPLLASKKPTTSRSASFAEVAGGTAAECAAICCCCPCGLLNLLLLAVYKVPAGLLQRALKSRRRRRLIKKGLLPMNSTPARCSSSRRKYGSFCSCDETEINIHPVTAVSALEAVQELEKVGKELAMAKELMELEKEMWDRFCRSGFGRSPSQREPQ
ncbi:hypothetical protein Nepgr_031839 [Nepenthes gracilis]|uniref:Uncharacterized protein n=1 Tax=Nepenthes gracilis TaxID=150966 RepID=A0AAD3TIW3_NEPGR|nr:hypothetical protein Nepgr_031839 [Nepenthes gracilis]